MIYIIYTFLSFGTADVVQMRAKQEERTLFWTILATLSVVFTYIIFFLIDKRKK